MKPLQNAAPTFNTGLFGIGLYTYLNQFETLTNRLSGYIDIVVQQSQEPPSITSS